MRLFCKRPIDRILPGICLLAGLATSGCGWLSDGGLRDLPLTASGRPEPADQASATSTGATSTGDRAVLARDSDAEHRSVWIRAVQRWPSDSSEPGYRWRYPALEELLARPPERRPNWHRYLVDEDPVVAANAAIALARSGDDSGAERLAETVRAPGIREPMRRAAVESLAGLKGPSVVPLLRELIDQYGRVPEPGATYHADLHAELIRGLARHVDPADEEFFLSALHSGAVNVRLEALRAWADGRGGSLPDALADLRDDANREVRAAALQALARRRHPEVHRYLAAALQDNELKVRIAAIAGLGELGGAEARESLEGMLQDQPEAIRGAAVSALAALGAQQAVLRTADDRSWRVRIKVAQALARYADGDATATASQLLQDPSAEVQRQVVVAMVEWPLQEAGPILLEAMGSRSLMTRRTAAEQLGTRWAAAAEFPVEGPPNRRGAVLEKLQRDFRQQFGLAGQVAPPVAAEKPPAVPITAELVDRVEQLVRQQEVRALVDFGPGLVEALQRLVFERHHFLPEAIYREVLPQYEPVFVALNRLTSSEESERRGAAGELVELSRQRPLGHLAVARLARLTVAEPDPLVWCSVLTAVGDDASEPSIRLAYAAISHPSAEVRRRACEHLAAHPHPEHARMLVPALEDRDREVVRAALNALGAARRLDDMEPLRQLLRTTDEDLRISVAVALIRLGDPAGSAALQRLAYSADARIRCRVALAMGETGSGAFTATLIHLLDDRPAVCRAALASLAKTVGHDAPEPEDPWTTSAAQRVRQWKQWFERRQDIGAGSASIRLY